MLQRRLRKTVYDRLAQIPAVGLIGPRQCGKTTLARSMEGEYFDLEQPEDRLRLDVRWNELVAGDELIVLDEAQTGPEVFPRLRGAIDAERKRNGRFLILGSVSPSLMRDVSESLAGRLSLVELTPLQLAEVQPRSADDLWLHGGFPDGGILDPSAYPRWQIDFVRLLAQRDLPAIGLSARPGVTERLLRMLAAWHGQPLNASRLAQSLGVSSPTVTSYIDVLEGAFLVRRLPAYRTNSRKRLVRTPRCYVRDSGIVHALLGVRDLEGLLNAPWVGASFEGFVIEQILGVLSRIDPTSVPYHFRTSDQYEVDLVVDRGDELWAIEVKLTSRPTGDDMARLDKTADMISATRRFLVTRQPEVVEAASRVACSLEWLLSWLEQNAGRA